MTGSLALLALVSASTGGVIFVVIVIEVVAITIAGVFVIAVFVAAVVLLLQL